MSSRPEIFQNFWIFDLGALKFYGAWNFCSALSYRALEIPRCLTFAASRREFFKLTTHFVPRREYGA